MAQLNIQCVGSGNFRMRNVFLFLFLIQMIQISSSFSHAQKVDIPVQAVAQVDLNRYLGSWFEIASIPQRFQKNCAGQVSAQYSLLSDGTINVINSCAKADGTMDIAHGNAKVIDRQSNAKLRVSFVHILGSWIYTLGGDYWIIDLAKDYSYAVVGHPGRKYAWILSRTPALPKEVLVGIAGRLSVQGYNTCDLLTTIQHEGAFSSRTPLCKVLP